ncbi:TPR_REGION domain-containing protein [Caenorhabditis elegans]|uniref:TPR_REGION domain-containing protein n=1 Tax=Caenorhabditis elegans TaxID=6239 RepID=Q93410_CAEEL|nr:TPR_REGION domain-containing protein [Caenorhabditis elegans]CAB02083.2 TPR_REGION domain-containing protein [Caenorhabditis elegans]|eukprot:NP_492160.2 Uncharacterized protein CELE_D2005.4 [Caenorhabditis elegans]
MDCDSGMIAEQSEIQEDSTKQAAELTVVSSVSEVDQENVKNTLHVIENKVEEPESAVVDEVEVPIEKIIDCLGVEAREDNGKVEDNVFESQDEAAGLDAVKDTDKKDEAATMEAVKHTDKEVKVKNRTSSVKSDISRNSVNENSENEVEPIVPDVYTIIEWEKKGEDYNVQQAKFVKTYYRKFASALQFIDPEFRFSAGIGPCTTFDSEGVTRIREKMNEISSDTLCPFEDGFHASAEEYRTFLTEVLKHARFCLGLACCERCFIHIGQWHDRRNILSVWGHEIDPLLELKTIKAIFEEIKDSFTKSEGIESRLLAEAHKIFDFMLPALEASDTQTLEENGISDGLATIHGRKEMGFEISEAEVDEMLEQSLLDEGFGEFLSTALHAPELFKTPKHLKLIYDQLEKMTKSIDIRVKSRGIQMISRIFEVLSEEEAMSLFDELREKPRISMEKMFGVNLATYDLPRNDAKRAQYLKIFYTTLGESSPIENFVFPLKRLVAAIECFYLIFSAFEFNTFIFKILSTRSKGNAQLDKDRSMLSTALLMLPDKLKKRLEIGPGNEPAGPLPVVSDVEDASSADSGKDNPESMYFQVVSTIRFGQRDGIMDRLAAFLSVTSNTGEHIISLEPTLRFAMRCVDAKKYQTMAVDVLKFLARPQMKRMKLPNEFFEDLIVLVLSKYNIPDSTYSEKLYQFIDYFLNLVETLRKENGIVIDEKKIVDKWANMGHHWFSIFFLSHRFDILKFSTTIAQLPWSSADIWNEEKKDPSDVTSYLHLAKLPTAWPNYCNLDVIEKTVSDHIPQEVVRTQLYEAMKKYAAEMPIDENWKKNLLRHFTIKIKFLTSHKKIDKEELKEDTKQSKEDSKVPEKSPEVLPGDAEKCEESEEVTTKASSDAKEGVIAVDAVAAEPDIVQENATSTDDANNEDQEKASQVVASSVISEEVLKEESTGDCVKTSKDHMDSETAGNCSDSVINDEPVEAEDPDNVKVERKEEDESIDGVSCDNEKIPLKPLAQCGKNCLYGFYPDDKWALLNEPVINEIYRLREKHGYSNKM